MEMPVVFCNGAEPSPISSALAPLPSITASWMLQEHLDLTSVGSSENKGFLHQEAGNNQPYSSLTLPLKIFCNFGSGSSGYLGGTSVLSLARPCHKTFPAPFSDISICVAPLCVRHVQWTPRLALTRTLQKHLAKKEKRKMVVVCMVLCVCVCWSVCLDHHQIFVHSWARQECGAAGGNTTQNHGGNLWHHDEGEDLNPFSR